MRRFELRRGPEDTPVAQGVHFEDGACVVHWLGANPSTVVWESFEAFEAVSVNNHPGQGRIVWVDGPFQPGETFAVVLKVPTGYDVYEPEDPGPPSMTYFEKGKPAPDVYDVGTERRDGKPSVSGVMRDELGNPVHFGEPKRIRVEAEPVPAWVWAALVALAAAAAYLIGAAQ